MERHILINGGMLRYHRQRAGLLQSELAAEIRKAGGDASGGFISKLERGERRALSVHNYLVVRTILGLEHDDLLAEPVPA